MQPCSSAGCVGGNVLHVLPETHRAPGLLNDVVGLDLVPEESRTDKTDSSQWIGVLVNCTHMPVAEQKNLIWLLFVDLLM